MADVPLVDALTPYFFAGVDLGPGVHDVLAVLHVDELDSAWDDDGVVVWGIARFDVEDPNNTTAFTPRAGGGPVARGEDGQPRPDAEVWDLHDVSIRFRLSIARRGTEVLPPTSITDTSLRGLLQAFGGTTAGTSSEYPGTQFRLDLLLNLVTITLPELRGARLEPNGMLVADPTQPRVKLQLPRILVTVEQGSTRPDTPFDVRVASWGATGLDGQSEEIAALLEMTPPYALVGSDNVFGFAFRSMVLDLDDSQTPPELLDKFGIGDDWQGVYLPEVRIFLAPQGLTGFAVNAGVRELLIGINETPGVWGDFMVDVINQGDALQVAVRFYDARRQRIEAVETPQGYEVSVPDEASMLVDILRGAAPYTIRMLGGRAPGAPPPVAADFDGAAAVDLSVTQHHNITAVRQQIALRITTRNPTQQRILVIEVTPRAAASETPDRPGEPRPGRIRHSFSDVPMGHSVGVERETPEGVVLRFAPADGASLRADGTEIPIVGGLATVRVPATGTVDLEIAWAGSAGRRAERLHVYFPYDRPETGEGPVPMSATPQILGHFTEPVDVVGFVSHLPAGETIRVDGFTSYEGYSNQAYNQALSDRRAAALEDLLRASTTQIGPVTGWGYHGHPSSSAPPELAAQLDDPDDRLDMTGREGHDTGEHAELYWRATASYMRDDPGTPLRATGTLTRDPATTPERQTPPDVPPPQPTRPDFLREIGATVRILQSEFVALEVRGKVDFHTATEQGLEEFRGTDTPGVEVPTPPITRDNPEDGVVDFRLNISHDDTTNIWTERLAVTAGEGDRDGLVSWGRIPSASEVRDGRPPDGAYDVGRDLLGLYFAMAPLLAEAAREEPDEGDIVALVVSLAIPPILVGLDAVHVLQFSLYGVEVSLKHHGEFEDGKFALLADVESALWLNLKFSDDFRIVVCEPDKPVRIRYKAIGFTINDGFDGTGPFVPVFDASRGYTIDLADSGSLKILPDVEALGEIIQLAGARIARTNPLNLEVELALGVDLGVFSVDQIGFRLPIDPLGAPTLTSLGVGIDIPNTIVGRGLLAFDETGFRGQVDISLPTVGLRIAAALGINSIEDAATSRALTAVFLSLKIELPAGIPLGGTGLGIFGFQGLFGMHYKRNEPETGSDRALVWLRDIVHGDPTDIRGWGPNPDSWAFGVGILLGTMEGAYVVRMTGMLALELPGPRILFFLKASLLNTKPPGNIEEESGTLLAVLDILFVDGVFTSITLGIQIDYTIKPILELMIPVEGFFDAIEPENFRLDIGTIARPITASVFEVFRATAYLMVHGNGIQDFPLGELQGFSIAAGFHVSITWGYEDINLYLKVASGFDAGIGFSPFFIAGRIYISGELILFIISIEASAELEAQSDGEDSWVSGEVCGSIDLFFFEVSGCVSFELGVKPGTPHAPDLCRGLALQSRSPALIRGTGVDRGIDTVLCRATTDGTTTSPEATFETPDVENEDGTTARAFVPIDAIPLLQFEVAPELVADFAIDGDLHGALPGGDDGWRKRGEILCRYRLESVTLTTPGRSDPVTAGERPNTWRPVVMDRAGDAAPIDLALLDWCPDPTPKAFEAGETRDRSVERRFGDVCVPTAPAAPVMWTFQNAPPGESMVGWELDGTAWSDPEGTRRTRRPDSTLRVTETWRTGDLLDALRTVVAARVVGSLAPCPQTRPRLTTGTGLRLDPRLAAEVIRSIPRLPIKAVGEEERLFERVAPIKSSSPAREKVGANLLGIPTLLPGVSLPTDLRPNLAPRVVTGVRRPGTTPGVTPAAPPPGQGQAPVKTRQAPPLFRAPFRNEKCPSRVLIAPYEHAGADRAPEAMRAQLDAALTARQNENLSDVVRFQGGPFKDFRVFALVRRSLLGADRGSGNFEPGLYRSRAYDRDGRTIGCQIAVQALAAAADVPASWRDVDGPWYHDLALGFGLFTMASRETWLPAIVTFTLAEPAWAIELGVQPLANALPRMSYPAFAIAAIEGLAQGEVDRAVADAAEAAADVAGLEESLAHDAATRALMHPDRRYEIVARYTAEVGEEREDGTHVIRPAVSITRTFAFHTDPEPPKRLHPWVLCEFPPAREPYHFYEDPIVVVFGTDDVVQLFAAYGRDLRGRVRDASFRPPAESPLRAQTMIQLGPKVMEKLAGVVFSPWEQTVRRMLGGQPCGNFNPDSPRHERAVLELLMEASSEYTFDVEAPLQSDGLVPPQAPGTIVEPLFRRGFSTSRYPSRQAMAEAVRVSYIAQRRIPDPAPLSALAEVCLDETLDAALIAAGLGVGERPREPRTTILWGDGATPRAWAILVETPEPLWRSRPEPEAIRDSAGRVTAWELVDKVWLSVDELVPESGGAPGYHPIVEAPFVRKKTGRREVEAPTLLELRDRYLRPEETLPAPTPAPRGSQVDRIVHDSSGCRTLVFLRASARGRTVSLGLVRNLNPLLDLDATDDPVSLLDVCIEQAPWEETR